MNHNPCPQYDPPAVLTQSMILNRSLPHKGGEEEVGRPTHRVRVIPECHPSERT